MTQNKNSNLHLILMDDDFIFNVIIENLLKKKSFFIDYSWVKTLEEAKNEIEKNKDKTLIFLCDLNLNRNLNGIDKLEYLHQNKTLLSLNIDIYVLTSSIFFEDKVKVKPYLENLKDHFIEKGALSDFILKLKEKYNKEIDE